MSLRSPAVVLPCALGGTTLGILALDPSSGSRNVPVVVLLATGAAMTLAVAVLLAGARWTVAGTASGVVTVGVLLGSLRAAGVALPAGPDAVTALVGKTEWRIAGTVTDDPRPRADRIQVVLESVTAVSSKPVAAQATRDPTAFRGRLLASLPRAVDAHAGDRVTFKATVEQPRDFNGFAYRAFLARQGIGAIARTFEASVSQRANGGVAAALSTARRWLLDGLDAIVPEPEAALGAGILLGVRSSIAPEISDSFAVAGLTHVVAISGWNIAILATLLGNLLAGLRRRAGGRFAVPLGTAAVVGGYVLLVGASPSVVRAALMAGALVIGRIGGSRAHAASALMLASEVMLLAAPPVLWDAGFQLSALATAGLIAFAAPIQARLPRLPGWIREPLALTLAAQLATLPVILSSFERLSLIAPVANVAIVPLVPLVMLCCALAAPIGAVDAVIHLPILGDAATWFAGGSAWLGLRVMIAAGSTAASMPGAALNVAPPPWLSAIWYPGLVLLWGRWARADLAPPPSEPTPLKPRARHRRPRCADLALRLARRGARFGSRPLGFAAIVTALLGCTTLITLPDGRLHLSVLDIGQGDAILILAPTGPAMLVDGGPDPELTLRRLGAALPWWRRDLAVVVLTHPHQDHVGGLVEVMRRYRVRLTIDSGRPYANADYGRFLTLARAEPESRLVLARAGQQVHLDPATTLDVIYPTDADRAAPLPRNDINNASVVMVLHMGAFTALLTGDAQAPVEATLAQRELIGPVDVLKVGHHGSNYATSELLLRTITPDAAIISVGAGNPYGHPGVEALARLASHPRIAVTRTDRDGTVQVISDGRSWTLGTRDGTTAARGARGRATAIIAVPPRHPGTSPATPGPGPGAGSIGAWPFRRPGARGRSWLRCRFRRASWSIRRRWHAWRSRPAGCSWRRGSRSTLSSSRSPPCCTTSTSRESASAEASTGLSLRGC